MTPDNPEREANPMHRWWFRWRNSFRAPWDRLNEDSSRIYKHTYGPDLPFKSPYWRWYGAG